MNSASGGTAPAFPGLVPELLITDLATSLGFWVTLCGFEILYDRPQEGFAYLQCGTARVMLEQIGVGRNWVADTLERPLGRGVNFQVSVPAITPLVERLAASDWPLFMAPEDKWYQTGSTEAGVSQFLVQDPDGYLIRFTSRAGAQCVDLASSGRVCPAHRSNSTGSVNLRPSRAGQGCPGDNEAMAENKTQPTDASVEDFLDAATPARRREDGKALDAIFREVTGADPVMWGSSIVGYGTYRYVSPANPRTRGDWMKTGFSPRKAQLSIYGLKDLPEGAALLPQLGAYTEGAGCVYVKKLDDIDLDVLRRLIAIAWSRGDDPA